MTSNASKPRPVVPSRALVLAALLAALAAFLFATALERLPVEVWFGYDWRSFYAAVQGGQASYAASGFVMRNPPWLFLPLVPVGLLSVRAGWALLTLFTLAVLIACLPAAPRRWQRTAALLLLLGAYTTGRHLSDGNFDGVVILGTILLLHSFRLSAAPRAPLIAALGLLLVTVKPQNAWLLVIVFALQTWRVWSPRRWLLMATTTAVVVLPTLLWKGAEWLEALGYQREQRGTVVDMSLDATAGRLGLGSAGLLLGAVLAVFALWLTLRGRPRFDRSEVALLVVSGLLLAPYAGLISMLSAMTLTACALLPHKPRLAFAVLLLNYGPYLLSRETALTAAGTYFTVCLLIYWLLLAWQVRTNGLRLSAA